MRLSALTIAISLLLAATTAQASAFTAKDFAAAQAQTNASLATLAKGGPNNCTSCHG